jgi:hypothetical protein
MLDLDALIKDIEFRLIFRQLSATIFFTSISSNRWLRIIVMNPVTIAKSRGFDLFVLKIFANVLDALGLEPFVGMLLSQ